MLSKHRLLLVSRTGLRRRKWCPAWRCSQDLNLKRDFVLFKLQDERWALPDLNRHPGYYEQPALTIELRARKGDTRSSVLRTAAARWLIIVRAYRWL